MPDIKESDWKLLRKVLPIALDRFAARSVAELQYLLTDRSKTAVDRFWESNKAMKRQTKEISLVFDDLRRSTAIIHLTAMRHRKLVTDEEMQRFSTETRDRVKMMLEL